MRKYIALLRGINVGGKNVLTMKDLVALLESMGAREVKTYIQSGNAVFTSVSALGDDWCNELTRRIAEGKGFTPQIMLLGKQDLDRAIRNNPYPAQDGKVLHCYFLAGPADQSALQEIERITAQSERVHLHEGVLYLFTPQGFGKSKLAARVEKLLGVPATARNWNTVMKLAQLSDE